MKLSRLIFSVLFIYGMVAVATENHPTVMNHKHNTTLTEAGNDVFGTIQEVIVTLNNNPNTNWKKVDVEKLRQHLLDMNDMTLNVKVIVQKPIPNGLEVVVKPTTDRAALALERVFKAHPDQLRNETGWNMKIVKNNGQYILTTISKNQEDTSKIRGLGYIGLMAYGKHHQPHHWALATGKNPHTGH